MTTTNTLERIRWERKRVQKELEHLEQVIADDFHELTAPPPPSNNKLEAMIAFTFRETSRSFAKSSKELVAHHSTVKDVPRSRCNTNHGLEFVVGGWGRSSEFIIVISDDLFQMFELLLHALPFPPYSFYSVGRCHISSIQ